MGHTNCSHAVEEPAALHRAPRVLDHALGQRRRVQLDARLEPALDLEPPGLPRGPGLPPQPHVPAARHGRRCFLRRHGSVGRVAARFSVVGGAMFSCRPPSGAQPLCCSGCNRCGTPACGVWGVLDGLNKVSGPGLDAIRTGGKTLADRVEGQLLLACAITAVQSCWQCDSKKLLAQKKKKKKKKKKIVGKKKKKKKKKKK